MNRSIDIERRFHELAKEIRSEPGFTEAVLLRADRVVLADESQPGVLRRNSGGGTVGDGDCCRGLAQRISAGPHAPAALRRHPGGVARVETVHIAGWTSQVVRKWPLEQPPQEIAIEAGGLRRLVLD